MEHTILLLDIEEVRRFNACGWLGYFLSLTIFDEEAVTKFTRTFNEGEAIVWGLTIVTIEEKIVEITRLPVVGEHYPNTDDARSAKAQFVTPTDA